MKQRDPDVPSGEDDQPFHLEERSDEELAEYDKGFEPGKKVSRTTTPRPSPGSAAGQKRRNKSQAPTQLRAGLVIPTASSRRGHKLRLLGER
jgi:hypothetical protein